MATRRMRSTLFPTASNIRRICRFFPSPSVTRYSKPPRVSPSKTIARIRSRSPSESTPSPVIRPIAAGSRGAAAQTS